MKRIKYVILIIITLLTINVKGAETCDSKEFARLKELAAKVEFDYDYKLVNDVEPLFTIKAVNLNKDIKVLIIEDYYSGRYKEFKDNEEHVATIDKFKPGERVVVTIKGNVPNMCAGKTVLTKTIKLPYYNFYYDEEVCKGNEEFKYCKQLIDNNITEKEFNKQLKQYTDKKYIEEMEEKESNEKEPEQSSTDIVKIVAIVVVAIVIVTIIVMIIMKRRKKNKL